MPIRSYAKSWKPGSLDRMVAVWQVPVHSLQASWNSVQMGCGDESVSACGVARMGSCGMCTGDGRRTQVPWCGGERVEGWVSVSGGAFA
jgi:hypothetical protein